MLNPETVAPVFAALGDPTRLALIGQLSDGASRSIRSLSADTRLTRQAVSKHLAVLEHAGLVASLKVGREARYSYRPEQVDEASAYLKGVAAQWDAALHRLKAFVEAGPMAWRRAGPADAAAVRALTRAAYERWIAVIGREPLPMTADYETAVREHSIDMLYIDGELAGLVEVFPQPDGLMIENVAVAPGWQGRGLGKSIVARAEDLARTLGLGRTRLVTNARFEANVRFYQGLGYALDETFAISDGFACRMSKTLA